MAPYSECLLMRTTCQKRWVTCKNGMKYVAGRKNLTRKPTEFIQLSEKK